MNFEKGHIYHFNIEAGTTIPSERSSNGPIVCIFQKEVKEKPLSGLFSTGFWYYFERLAEEDDTFKVSQMGISSDSNTPAFLVYGPDLANMDIKEITIEDLPLYASWKVVYPAYERILKGL